MRREDKRRRFHESLLNTLYPPVPQPQSKADDETETPTTTFDVNLIPDDYGLQASGSSTSDNDDDGESQCGEPKLTRARRKRLRKKKLNEDISRRKLLIGPLRPDGDGGSTGEECTPPVRRNDESCGGRKVKQRRMGKESFKPSEVKDSL